MPGFKLWHSCRKRAIYTCDFPSWNLHILKPNESIVLNCVLGFDILLTVHLNIFILILTNLMH